MTSNHLKGLVLQAVRRESEAGIAVLKTKIDTAKMMRELVGDAAEIQAYIDDLRDEIAQIKECSDKLMIAVNSVE